MAIGQVLVKTFSNGTKVFSKEVLENGVRKIRTTAMTKDGHLISDRLKTIDSEPILGGKMNTVTKHYYGRGALGEAYTQGRYDIAARIYENGNKLSRFIDLHTTPTYLKKYGSWSGSISEVNGKHPNALNDLNKYFDCDTSATKFNNIRESAGICELPTIVGMDNQEVNFIQKLINKLNFMKINENYRG